MTVPATPTNDPLPHEIVPMTPPTAPPAPPDPKETA